MGKLIVFEGTDGTGKSTQFALLTKRLQSENIPFRRLQFPQYLEPSSALIRMYLNGEDVTKEIRLPMISKYASDVSAIPEVRAFLMELQRSLAREHSVIMDGRDIGTVILPDAQVKIFLTASNEARARRRVAELAEKGMPVDYETVLADMYKRDEEDRTRAVAPAVAAPDAIRFDNSGLTFEESVEAILNLIRETLAGKGLSL